MQEGGGGICAHPNSIIVACQEPGKFTSAAADKEIKCKTGLSIQCVIGAHESQKRNRSCIPDNLNSMSLIPKLTMLTWRVHCEPLNSG